MRSPRVAPRLRRARALVSVSRPSRPSRRVPRLSRGVDVLARGERFPGERAVQEPRRLRTQRVPPVPVLGVVLVGERLLPQVTPLEHEELVVRVVHDALVHPALDRAHVRLRRRAEQAQRERARARIARARGGVRVQRVEQTRAAQVARAHFPRRRGERRQRARRRARVEPQALQREPPAFRWCSSCTTMTRQSCSISSISAASAWRTSPPSNDPDAASQNAAAAAADAHKGSASRASAWSEPSSPGSISNEISSPVSARRATTNRPSTPSAAYSKSSTTSSSWHAAEYSRRGLPGVTNARGAPRCAPVRYGLRRVHPGRRGDRSPRPPPDVGGAVVVVRRRRRRRDERAPRRPSLAARADVERARARARVSATANAPSSASFESREIEVVPDTATRAPRRGGIRGAGPGRCRLTRQRVGLEREPVHGQGRDVRARHLGHRRVLGRGVRARRRRRGGIRLGDARRGDRREQVRVARDLRHDREVLVHLPTRIALSLA